jgi:ABC-type transport system involved in cytochrome c biogenesis permease subunit
VLLLVLFFVLFLGLLVSEYIAHAWVQNGWGALASVCCLPIGCYLIFRAFRNRRSAWLWLAITACFIIWLPPWVATGEELMAAVSCGFIFLCVLGYRLSEKGTSP